VEYITYNTSKSDLPDIYALAFRPTPLKLGHIYQASIYALALRPMALGLGHISGKSLLSML